MPAIIGPLHGWPDFSVGMGCEQKRESERFGSIGAAPCGVGASAEPRQQEHPEWCRRKADRRTSGIYLQHPYGLGPCYDCGGPHNARFGRLYGLHTEEYCVKRRMLDSLIKCVPWGPNRQVTPRRPKAAAAATAAAPTTAASVACQTEDDEGAEREEMVYFWLPLTAGVASDTAESNTSGGAQPAASKDEGASNSSVGIEPSSEPLRVSWHAHNPLYGGECTGGAESSMSDGPQQECASTVSEEPWERSSSEEASCAWEHPQGWEVLELRTPFDIFSHGAGEEAVRAQAACAREDSSLCEKGDPG